MPTFSFRAVDGRSVVSFLAGVVVTVGATSLMRRGPAPESAATTGFSAASAPTGDVQAAALPERVKMTTADGDRAVSELSAALSEADRDRRCESLRHLAGVLASQDVRAALEIGGRIPDCNDQREFLRSVFAQWAAAQPVEALSRALAYPAGLLRSETLNAALGAWTPGNPRAALTWVEENVDGPPRSQPGSLRSRVGPSTIRPGPASRACVTRERA